MTSYSGFISYSHRDERIAAKLHRKLERYRIPKTIGSGTSGGKTHSRSLRPIFRDRDELASSPNLSEAIVHALDSANALIVVCSPAAAASRWVNQEISYFRSRHQNRQILAFIVAGEPSADAREDVTRAAFPTNLVLSELDQPSGSLLEPLAADARSCGDGFSLATLRLIAGLLHVNFDQLRRREYKRNQFRWFIGAATSTALSVAFATLAWQAVLAKNQARAAQLAAEIELASEQQTRTFLLSVFSLADARESRGNIVTVREVLDSAVSRIDTYHFNRPEIRSKFLGTMGQAYSSLGLNRKAADMLEESIRTLRASGSLDENFAQWVDTEIELADVLLDMGDYSSSERTLDALYDGTSGPRTLSQAQVARAANIRGDVLSFTERDTEARAAYTQAIEAMHGLSKKGVQEIAISARSIYGQAVLTMYAGDFKSADAQFQECIGLLRTALGDNDPQTITAILSRGSNAYNSGDYESAEKLWKESLQIANQIFDPDNPQIATIKNNLGRLLLESGDLESAEHLIRDAIKSDRLYRASDFDDLAFSLTNLAIVRQALGDNREAHSLLDEALPIARNSQHRMLGSILNHLADLECDEGNSANGVTLAEESVRVSELHESPGSWRLIQSKITLAYCHAASGTAVDEDKLIQLASTAATLWRGGNPFKLRAEVQLKFINENERLVNEES